MTDERMTLNEARAEIEAILAAIPDDEIPTFPLAQINRNGTVTVLTETDLDIPFCIDIEPGHILGTAPDPLYNRRIASMRAIEGEMYCRAEAKFLANGRKLDGLGLVKKEPGPTGWKERIISLCPPGPQPKQVP